MLTTRPRRLRWILATLFALAAPAAFAQWISPGPLAEGHAKLDDVATCEKCHAPGKRVEAARCLSCHTEVAIPLSLGRGFHARLVRESGKACESCHSDHHGRAYPLIRWSPPPTFDHGKEVGFGLTGAHARIACEACHENRPRYMGEPTTCVGCHKDPHAGSLGRTCESCHDSNAFAPAPRFDHAKTKFPLENKHLGVPCTSCHAPVASGSLKFTVKSAERCSTCHGDPHGGRTALSPCSDCHTTVGWRDVKNVPPAHSPAGWPLVGRHSGVACADCHGPSLTAKVSSTCASCHEDVHKGRFGKKCESCHDEAGWKQVKLTGFDHSKTRYALEGRHQQVRCEKCHRPVGGKTTWKGLAFDRCARCHQPWHQDSLASARATECEACHTVQGFAPSTFASDAHARARFPLEGSHLAVPCESCHTRASPRPTPLALGVKRCADCHADPHAGQFAAQMADGRSCGACHTTSGWAKDAFDHDATAFPLRGVHAAAACESCHVGNPIRYKGLATTCEGCHRDPHLGQLAARPCVACHSQVAWAIEPFDHGALTGYALDGRHAPLACEACHETRTSSDGTAVTRFDLGYQACADCHANPHRASARKRRSPHAGVPDIGGACESCHVTASWRVLPKKVAFDHALTGFPLDGRHAAATCVACHGPALRTEDARRDCASCHDDTHRGELGDRCETCHDARSWHPSDTLVNHRATAFPLVGAHAAADCTACHDTLRQDRWTRPAADCYACHARDYQRTDLHPNHVTAKFSRQCDTCHAQDAFSPARVRHDVFWPLRGAHTSADCFACHEGGRYGGTPRTCIGCHEDEYLVAADPPHASYGLSQRCETCHTEVSWSSVRPTWHDPAFPISSGKHARFGCNDCHPAGVAAPNNFTCIGCHGERETAPEHDEVRGYVWENFACYACHPRGEE